MKTYQIRTNGEFLCFIKADSDTQAREDFKAYAKRESKSLSGSLELVGLSPEGKRLTLSSISLDNPNL